MFNDFHGSFDSHTKVKLDLYEKYLEVYLSILSNVPHVSTINIYDLFCGQGKTEQGEYGSAFRAFKTVKNACYKINKPVEYNLYFYDKEKACHDKLTELLSSYKCPDKMKYHIKQKEFTESLKESCKHVRQTNINTTQSLFFIDPFGYKETEPKDFLKIIQLPRTEVIFFLPINQMYRFVNSDEKNVPLQKWHEFIGKPDQIESQSELVEMINRRFSSYGYFTGSFQLINQKNKNHYALFFMSSNIYGLEKFNEVKWKLDTCEGKSMEFEHDALQISVFEEYIYQETLKELRVNLVNYLTRGDYEKISNNELYSYIIKHGYLPTHFNSVFKENAFLDVEYCGPKFRKGSTYINYTNYKGNTRAYFKVKNENNTT